MYNTDYLAALFGVSATTIRVYLRTLGLGVGTAGTYQFGADEIEAVVNELAGVLKRDPLVPASSLAPPATTTNESGLSSGNVIVQVSAGRVAGLQGNFQDSMLAAFNTPSVSGGIGTPVSGRAERVKTFAKDNRITLIYLILGLISAIIGIDLAL